MIRRRRGTKGKEGKQGRHRKIAAFLCQQSTYEVVQVESLTVLDREICIGSYEFLEYVKTF